MAGKLFVPGPSEVGPEVLGALATPLLSHRSDEFREIHTRLISRLKKFLHTSGGVYLATASATGMMEGSVRNLVSRRCLCLASGAYGERWHAVAAANGKAADKVSAEWGKAVLPEAVDQALATRKYDSVTLVHSETSTGVMSPLPEIASVLQKHPEVVSIVDCSTSMAVVDLNIDALGIDLAFTGSQGGFGLPPGLTVFTASRRAMERAKRVENRGTYFDLLEFEKAYRRGETPFTPAIPLVFALDRRLEMIEAAGARGWFSRHEEMARRCREWAGRNFRLFPETGRESNSLTCIENTRKINVAGLRQELGMRGMRISDGYGKLRGSTFRIGHMGDVTLGDMERLLEAIDGILKL